METNKLYDIHFHAMDLSHANLTAFTTRILNDKNIDLEKLEKRGIILYFILYFIKNILNKLWKGIKSLPKTIIDKIKSIFKNKQKAEVSINKIRNLLSFMESSIKYDFLIVEHFLKNKAPIVSANNEFTINDITYNKIVLCPLIMDFGYKNIDNENIFYNIPPQKPITSQIKDLFKAIETYYNNEITIKKENGRKKFDVKEAEIDKSEKLFEIYPFMGINPDNYDYTRIEKMLSKYFSNFSKKDTQQERQRKLYEKMGSFNGDLDNEKNCKNIFAGIKLYPPLGFNPWPEDCSECDEKEAKGENCECNKAKVKLLYKTCVERNIPITTHCSNGGFKAAPNPQELTDPGNWAIVLKEYPGLKINFAHFGSGDKGWQQTIIEHILKPGSNVYTDFSCNTENDKYYQKLEKTISESSDSRLLSDRVLFGSDFMINLIWVESYNEYIKYFKDTNHLSTDLKRKFCHTNSEKFLFGESPVAKGILRPTQIIFLLSFINIFV